MNKILSAILLVFLWAMSSYAAPAVFSGLDLGNGEDPTGYVPPLDDWPNSEGAEVQFFSNLNSAFTVDFEMSTPGDTSPTVNFGGGINATFFNGTGSGGFIDTLPYDNDGYPISISNHWESRGSFAIQFSEEINAFGFYATDLGPEDPQNVFLKYRNTATGFESNINLGPNNLDAGSVKYFGFYDLDNSFDWIGFGTVENGIVMDIWNSDWFGVDNISIGAPVPIPTTMLLLGSGLVGLAGFRRKFKKA